MHILFHMESIYKCVIKKGFPIFLPSDNVLADLNILLGKEKHVQQRSAALFLLKIKEHRRISQVAIDDIVQEWGVLFSSSVHYLHARVRERIASEITSIDGLQEVFEDAPSPFEGLETRYKQEKFYTESLGLVVRCPTINSPYSLQTCGNQAKIWQPQAK